MGEIWKDINGYEGYYQISTLGRVKSLERKNSLGILRKGRILKGGLIRGYLVVSLWKNNKDKNWPVHRLVGIHFIENPLGHPIINHKNSIKNDNRVENLEWCTQSYNVKYGFTHNGVVSSNKGKIGELNHGAKKVGQFDKLSNLIKIWGSIADAARELTIRHTQISDCCNFRAKSAGGFIWKFL